MIVTTVGKFAGNFDLKSGVLHKLSAEFGDIFLFQQECYVERSFLEDLPVMFQSKCSSFEAPDIQSGFVRQQRTCLHHKSVAINKKCLYYSQIFTDQMEKALGAVAGPEINLVCAY